MLAVKKAEIAKIVARSRPKTSFGRPPTTNAHRTFYVFRTCRPHRTPSVTNDVLTPSPFSFLGISFPTPPRGGFSGPMTAAAVIMMTRGRQQGGRRERAGAGRPPNRRSRRRSPFGESHTVRRRPGRRGAHHFGSQRGRYSGAILHTTG